MVKEFAGAAIAQAINQQLMNLSQNNHYTK